MNPGYINKGGWQNSQLRKVLNNSVIEALPVNLRKVIEPYLKKTSLDGNSEKYGLTSDPLFVLSKQEIFGREIHSHDGEGHWHGWYHQENAEYEKCKRNGERDWRWERSSLNGYTGDFCHVNSSGDTSFSDTDYPIGVPFDFCV